MSAQCYCLFISCLSFLFASVHVLAINQQFWQCVISHTCHMTRVCKSMSLRYLSSAFKNVRANAKPFNNNVVQTTATKHQNFAVTESFQVFTLSFNSCLDRSRKQMSQIMCCVSLSVTIIFGRCLRWASNIALPPNSTQTYTITSNMVSLSLVYSTCLFMSCAVQGSLCKFLMLITVSNGCSECTTSK